MTYAREHSACETKCKSIKIRNLGCKGQKKKMYTTTTPERLPRAAVCKDNGAHVAIRRPANKLLLSAAHRGAASAAVSARDDVSDGPWSAAVLRWCVVVVVVALFAAPFVRRVQIYTYSPRGDADRVFSPTDTFRFSAVKQLCAHARKKYKKKKH